MRLYIERYSQFMYRGIGYSSNGLPIIVFGRSFADVISKALVEC